MAGTVNEAAKLARALREAGSQARNLTKNLGAIEFRPGSVQNPVHAAKLSEDQQFEQRARRLGL